ncbi:alpha-amylase family glycosyl hydrolase [Flavilitoribacter nigricans]|uniref:Alpha-amylase n=1 Tax=Flavilitoribacter nigricans (strain ATCC 23147 / DSM 23189 / NBRC 102662 / NCIMB 1420 / SS-2) TaxID=1122177 RepID=A0A2D0NFP5_FLAN2|nr:alpha-amylase family glycosyl hydrolase [Flavilitoribacter nigricans]PHN06603.1 alpha-amlyase [Flavilitoribacter nigricans DSM 23189 = NBRC 102662]
MKKTVRQLLLSAILLLPIWSCMTNRVPDGYVPYEEYVKKPVSDFWKNATVYFLLTDRFQNGNTDNDLVLGRKQDGAKLRSFMGGDLQGITQKIREGYFEALGVDAIWMTPIVEQVHGFTDEGTGKTYGYHGYWARDWTRLDPNFGTEADFAELVEAAHERGIRILMDVVMNHTGPVTEQDSQWPDAWVRTEPTCTYTGYTTTVSCTLVDNLPDIRTGSDEAVELPAFLKEKWAQEGRLEEEMRSLDEFFKRTGLPRAPRFYLVKWFRDWVRKYGLDGFRIDTAKHTEASIWEELKKECREAFWEWKKANPKLVIDREDFYMVGEVYGFGVGGDRAYNYGDREVDFFDNGFESLINFAFKSDASMDYEALFSKYNTALNGGPLQDVSILNYVSSHDDGSPFDATREKALEAGTKLLLCPGGVQIYYGDETARPLRIEGTEGDANLRSFMNWEDVQDPTTQAVLEHWQKLGQFRQQHPAVGAGIHRQLNAAPYFFSRTLEGTKGTDKVVVALELPPGPKQVPLFETFPEGTVLKDYYSGISVVVRSDKVTLDSPYGIALLGEEE